MIQATALACGIGMLIGLALGMLGGGGSLLTVPALVYLLDQDAQSAVSTALVIVGLNALVGAGLHHRHGHVRWRDALAFGGAGIGTAYGGARLSRLLPSAWLLVLFGGLMLILAIVMLRTPQVQPREQACPRRWWLVLLAGAGVGFSTGFLGVGGGFLIVPALVIVFVHPKGSHLIIEMGTIFRNRRRFVISEKGAR